MGHGGLGLGIGVGWAGLCGQIWGFGGLILGLEMMGFGGYFSGLGRDRLGLQVGGSDFWPWWVVLGHGGVEVGDRGGCWDLGGLGMGQCALFRG